MTPNSIRCRDAVRHMSVNAGARAAHRTDSHGQRPLHAPDLQELQSQAHPAMSPADGQVRLRGATEHVVADRTWHVPLQPVSAADHGDAARSATPRLSCVSDVPYLMCLTWGY